MHILALGYRDQLLSLRLNRFGLGLCSPDSIVPEELSNQVPV